MGGGSGMPVCVYEEHSWWMIDEVFLIGLTDNDDDLRSLDMTDDDLWGWQMMYIRISPQLSGLWCAPQLSGLWCAQVTANHSGGQNLTP